MLTKRGAVGIGASTTITGTNTLTAISIKFLTIAVYITGPPIEACNKSLKIGVEAAVGIQTDGRAIKKVKRCLCFIPNAHVGRSQPGYTICIIRRIVIVIHKAQLVLDDKSPCPHYRNRYSKFLVFVAT